MSPATPPQNPGEGQPSPINETETAKLLASLPSLTGTTLERYSVEALIGKGGMGEVYRAVDSRLKRKVALKVLRPDKDRPDAVARLFREARAAAALSHPNTVAIHDIGEYGGLFYIVMELVNGMPLLAYVGDDNVPIARKLRWLADVARALTCAHRAGVIHRDVKPSNVMVSEDDVAKVLDFGLAKPVEPKSFDFNTQAGHVVGTVRYMSPEQVAGADADARSDQYSFGVTAYELLSGRYPGGHPLGIPVPLDNVIPGFPKDGAEVIGRAMKRAADERFASMNDLVTALEDLANNRPVRASMPPGATAGATAALPAKQTSHTAIADTMRDPSGGLTAPTAVAAAAPSPALAATLTAPMPGSDALVQRRAAHARSHEVTRTLLSQKVDPALAQRLTATARVPGRPANVAPTLASPSPAVLAARAAAAAPRVPSSVAVVMASAPPPASKVAPRVSSMTIVIAAVVLLAIAAFAGTYLGSRARPSVAPTDTPSAPK